MINELVFLKEQGVSEELIAGVAAGMTLTGMCPAGLPSPA